MGDSQVTIGVTTTMVVSDLDDDWGYLHDLENLHMSLSEKWEPHVPH